MINVNKLVKGAAILYEEFCYIHSTVSVIGNVKIGAYSYCGQGGILGGGEIGRFCSIAPNVTIGLGEHEISYVSTHPFFFASKNGFVIPSNIGVPRDFSLPKHGKVIIGNDVWIGANVYIAKGVTIGDGAVIAAGAVVMADVEAYSIVGGIPAKHIKYRFEESLLRDVKESQWWKYDLQNFVGLNSSNPKEFIEGLKKKDLKIANYKWLTISSRP